MFLVSRSAFWLFRRCFLNLFHRCFRRLESDLRVRSIAKRLVHRSTTATQRKCRLPGQVIWIAVRIDQFNRSFGGFHPERTISTNRDLYLRHSLPPQVPGALRRRFIVAENGCRSSLSESGHWVTPPR